MATAKREIAALRSPRFVIARNVAISVFYRWQTEKREIAALRSLRFVIARNEAISLFSRWQQPKERLPRCARLSSVIARNVAISPDSCQNPFAGSQGNHVIARNEAISLFSRWRTAKREIAALRSQ
jgi:hypothetical protein